MVCSPSILSNVRRQFWVAQFWTISTTAEAMVKAEKKIRDVGNAYIFPLLEKWIVSRKKSSRVLKALFIRSSSAFCVKVLSFCLSVHFCTFDGKLLTIIGLILTFYAMLLHGRRRSMAEETHQSSMTSFMQQL